MLPEDSCNKETDSNKQAETLKISGTHIEERNSGEINTHRA